METLTISLSMLYNQLFQRLPTEFSSFSDKQCICRIRAYRPTLPMDADTLYIREDGDNTTLLLHESGSISVFAPMPDTLNAVMDIFTEFHSLHDQLQAALKATEPFQAIAEIASSMLRCPVIINSNVFRILGIAGEDSGAPWEYSKINRFSPPAFVNYYTHPSRYQTYISGRHPLIQKLPDSQNWFAILRINCFFQAQAKCRLCVSIPSTDCSPGFVQTAEYIASFIERISSNVAEKYFCGQYTNNPYVSDSGQPIKCQNFLYQQLLSKIGNQKYLLCYIRSLQTTSNGVEIFWIYSRLESLNTDTVQYLFRNNVILLVPWCPDIRSKLSHLLLEMLTELNLVCLVSNPCSGLDHIQDCIRQANMLFKELTTPYPRFMYYEDFAQQCLIREIASKVNSDIWLYSGLTFLENYDTAHNTDYYTTLCCLAQNHFIQSFTATELFIHRNSLQYRIKRVEELLNCNLSDPSTQFFISLSVFLQKARQLPSPPDM